MHHLIPFRPFVHLVRIMFSYGGIHLKQLPALLPWMLKTIAIEPFRLAEAFYIEVNKKKAREVNPVFILGFYRSGTTWLQQLIAADPELVTPGILQSVLPEVMFTLEPVLRPVIGSLASAFGIENAFHRIPFRTDFPGEDDVAINALVYLTDFNRIFQYPSHAGRILQLHMPLNQNGKLKEWERAHRYFTTKLTLKYPGRQLVLKSPPNTGRVALLKKMYPGAKFIFIKRDPLACIHSNVRLWDINRAFSFEAYTEDLSEQIIVSMHKRFHERYLEEKEILGSDELAEVEYEELIREPVETIARIYQKLGLPDSEAKRMLRVALADKNSGYTRVKHVYSDRLTRLVAEEIGVF
jgi:omega-hydroxy-beta-dihydromenaquinone-9 sulfotransferase